MIVDIWQTMEMKPFPVHVKGHQDKVASTLSRLECLNILMDKLATIMAPNIPNQGEPLCLYKIGLPRVKLNNSFITGKLTKVMYDGLTAGHLQRYLHTNVLGEAMNVSLIDFTAFEQARSQASTSLNIFMSKWYSNTLATGVVMQKRKHRIFNRCPRCNHWGEDRYHIIKCWDTRANIIWNKQLEMLQQLLCQLNTCPEIASLQIARHENHPTTARGHTCTSWKLETQTLSDWMDEHSDGFYGQENGSMSRCIL
jgi:hypothetical protein